MNDLIQMLSLGFVQRALVAGVVISLVSGLVGLLVVLRRESFFGDALAHASLTGVALALILGLNPLISALAYALLVALILSKIKNNQATIKINKTIYIGSVIVRSSWDYIGRS